MERLTRSRFVAAAAAGIAGVAAPQALAAPPGTTVYFLDPCGGPSEGGRCSCRACESHAANKIFLTAAAADSGRAHPHCNCAIVSKQVTHGLWKVLELRARGGAFDKRTHTLPPGLAKQL